MILEIIAIAGILTLIMWLFGGGQLAATIWGGAVAYIGICMSLYATFAFLHKWLGPYIFN